MVIRSRTLYLLGAVVCLVAIFEILAFPDLRMAIGTVLCGYAFLILAFIYDKREKRDTEKDIKIGKQLNHYDTLIKLGHSKDDAIKIAKNEETVIFPTPKNDKNKSQQD